MNLVCFPSFTAGGLVCNLLNEKFTTISGVTVKSREHNVFKTGDNWKSPYKEYIKEFWEHKIKIYSKSSNWFGTHCHPSVIECLSSFDKKIAITTKTETSKYYRFLRSYYIYFQSQVDPQFDINGLVSNILNDEFESHNDCTNIEFSDIVDGTFVKEYNLNLDYFNIWKEKNIFLYKENSLLTQHFNKGLEYAIQKSY
jgi:hypothetical protein